MTTIIITGKYYFHFQIFYSYYHGANPIFWILFIFFYAERKSSIMNYESNHNSFQLPRQVVEKIFIVLS